MLTWCDIPTNIFFWILLSLQSSHFVKQYAVVVFKGVC
jgi:hypothetical protein